MIFLIIIGFICQIGLYLATERIDFRGKRTIILFIMAISYLFAVPPLFYPEIDPDGVNCGMPALGITLFFFIFGLGGSIIIHLIYHFGTKPLR